MCASIECLNANVSSQLQFMRRNGRSQSLALCPWMASGGDLPIDVMSFRFYDRIGLSMAGY